MFSGRIHSFQNIWIPRLQIENGMHWGSETSYFPRLYHMAFKQWQCWQIRKFPNVPVLPLTLATKHRVHSVILRIYPDVLFPKQMFVKQLPWVMNIIESATRTSPPFWNLEQCWRFSWIWRKDPQASWNRSFIEWRDY